MYKIDINSDGLYDLDCSIIPDSLKEKAIKCILMQKKIAQANHNYQPDMQATEKVSQRALDDLRQQNIDIHGISTDRNISNVICFGANNIGDAIHNAEVQTLREEVDSEIVECLSKIFELPVTRKLISSGHFWYPKQSMMGWHTNSQSPGWRIYINYAEEESESFFRYKDNDTNELKTLWDKTWNLRVFRVTQENQIWHCVYSNTNRFSLGYMLKEPQPRRFIQKVADLFR